MAVVIHERQGATSDADLAAVGHIDRIRPQFVTRFGVQRHGHAQVVVFDAVFGEFALFAGELGEIGLVLRQQELALLWREGGVDEENAAIADGDGLMRDVLALIAPFQRAGLHVIGEDLVGRNGTAFAASGDFAGLFDAFRFGAVEQAVFIGDVAPLQVLLGACAGDFQGADDFARRGVELEALVFHEHEEEVVARGHVAGFAGVINAGAHRPGVLRFPEELAVVGVVGHHAVLSLDKKATVSRNWSHCAVMAVHHLAGAGIAIP